MNERIRLWNLHAELKYMIAAVKAGKKIPKTKIALWESLTSDKVPDIYCDARCISWMIHAGPVTQDDRTLFEKLRGAFVVRFRQYLVNLAIDESYGHATLHLKITQGTFQTAVDAMVEFLQCYLMLAKHIQPKAEEKTKQTQTRKARKQAA